MTEKNEQEEFAAEAGQPQIGFLRELVDFLLNNKKWGLIPIILCLLMFGLLLVLGGGAAAPFIYTLF